MADLFNTRPELKVEHMVNCALPVETFVQATLGSGFPVALHGRRTSLSASTDTLAVVTVVMRGLAPPPPSNIHRKGGAAVGWRELIRPAIKLIKASVLSELISKQHII